MVAALVRGVVTSIRWAAGGGARRGRGARDARDAVAAVVRLVAPRLTSSGRLQQAQEPGTPARAAREVVQVEPLGQRHRAEARAEQRREAPAGLAPRLVRV